MLIAGDWGATWSVDAIRAQRLGRKRIDIVDSSHRFVIPVHATLVVLAALFCSAGLWKLEPWLSGDNVIGYHLLETNLKLVKLGMPLNPIANWFIDYPILEWSLRLFVVIFELTFPLALINRRLRNAYLFTGLLFNVINGAFLGVTFTTLVIVYALFADWQAIANRICKTAGDRRSFFSDRWIPAFVVIVAFTVSIMWIKTWIMHDLLTIGGLLDRHTILLPLVPIAIIGCARAWWIVGKRAFSR